MRSIPDAVCWTEGMHLLPQHFQLQSLRAESLSARLAKNARPWFWGVHALGVDASLLVNKVVRLTALDAVMPDGLAVNLDPVKDEGFFPQLTLTEQDFGGVEARTVYLAVNGIWQGDKLQPQPGRLRSRAESMADLSCSGADTFVQTVHVWRPHLRLTLDGTSPDAEYLPLMRLGWENNSVVPRPYTPPSPVLATESDIGKRIAHLCHLVHDKCRALAGFWRQAQLENQSSVAAELRMQRNALMARLPELQANLETGVATPLSLYVQLNGMVGSVSCLQPDLEVPVFAPLDFKELQAGFDQVLDWLTPQIEAIHSGYQRRQFSKTPNLFHIILNDTTKTDQHLVIALRMPGGSAPQAAREWLNQANIASREYLPQLRQLRGAGLKFVGVDPKEKVAYGVDANTHIFAIQARGEWFRPDHELCLYVPQSTTQATPVEITLFDSSKSD